MALLTALIAGRKSRRTNMALQILLIAVLPILVLAVITFVVAGTERKFPAK